MQGILKWNQILHKMKTKRSLLNTIKKRKCQYFGHIIRGNRVQRLLMEGRINGRRGRGRPKTMWTDNIKEWTKISYNDYQSGTRSRTMEIHDSRPVDYRWHIMVMMESNGTLVREHTPQDLGNGHTINWLFVKRNAWSLVAPPAVIIPYSYIVSGEDGRFLL